LIPKKDRPSRNSRPEWSGMGKRTS